MSSIANPQSGSESSQFPAAQTSLPSIDPLEPLFLMINSLEVGGSERQFAELARSLRAEHLQVHLGCVQKKGAFLDGLGELH